MNPAPGLIDDFVGWDAVLLFAAVVGLAELIAFARRWRRESAAIDAELEATQAQHDRYTERQAS